MRAGDLDIIHARVVTPGPGLSRGGAMGMLRVIEDAHVEVRAGVVVSVGPPGPDRRYSAGAVVKLNLRATILVFALTVAPLVFAEERFGFLREYVGFAWALLLVPWFAVCAFLTRRW